MKLIGVSFALRKAGSITSSTTTISAEGDDVRIATTSTVKSSNNLFKINGEVDEKTLDGRNVKTSYKWDGDTLVGTQKWDGKVTTLSWAAHGKTMTLVNIDLFLTCSIGYRP